MVKEEKKKSLLLVAALFITLLASIPSLLPPAHAATAHVGIIVPLYMYPNSYWKQLISAKNSYPNVLVIAIINPNSGPGYSPDSYYQSWVSQLQQAGIITYGYIDTAYGAVDQGYVNSQIQQYQQWYSVQGIFLDSLANQAGYEQYYSSITSYAHSLNLQTIGNPGTTVPSSYFPTVDELMIYEGGSLPSLSYLQQANQGLQPDPSDFSFIAYSVRKVPSQSYFNAVAQDDSFVWLTNRGASYQDLPKPTYLNQLMSELALT